MKLYLVINELGNHNLWLEFSNLYAAEQYIELNPYHYCIEAYEDCGW